MTKKEEICKKEVCFCIRDAIIYEKDDCLFIPEGVDSWRMGLDVWDDSSEDDEAVVIVNPFEEFELDGCKYFRLIKTITDKIFDFRDTEKKFGIYVYLVKRHYENIGHYVFYYKGKVVSESGCPPTFYDIVNLLGNMPELKKYHTELIVIRHLADLLYKMRILIIN